MAIIGPNMSWYYSKNGTQLGPVTEQELSEKVSGGEVSASDLIWKEGMPDWKPASQVPEFSGMISNVPAPTNSGGTGNIPMAQPPAYSSSQFHPNIPNYLWQSIVSTILCCMPFGVVAIVYAAKVDGLVARGDIAGAEAASKSAKTWVTAAVGSWLVIMAIYLILVFAGLAAGSLQ